MAEQTLKSSVTKWLVALAAFDAVALISLIFGVEFFLIHKIEEVWRAALAALLVVPVSLVADSFSPKFKAQIVFWRWLSPLPGSRAFSKDELARAGVDRAKLVRNVGRLPVSADNQDARWYELYNMVRDRANVLEVHGKYLRYRDMAALSLGLIVVAPMGAILLGSDRWLTLMVFFGAQYLWSVWLCRLAGQRFSQTVLRIHAAERIA